MRIIEAYEIMVCRCPEPYVGARKAGTVDKCLTCDFITPEHFSYIIERYGQ